MPTINGVAIHADETPMAFAEVSIVPNEHPAFMDDGSMVSRAEVVTCCSALGAWSAALRPGQYRVTIKPLDSFLILVPADPEVDEYDVAEILSTPDGVIGRGFLKEKWFEDVGEMLAADSRVYASCNLRNMFGNDGIISTWKRVLLTSPEAAGLVESTDSVRESNDGFAFWVRLSIAS